MAFREMARINQALPEAECIEILKNEKRGILSVLGDDDYPYGVPINHFYNEDDGRIYFHGGMAGHKIDAMKKHDKASFCVMDEGVRPDNEWWLMFKSVIVFGRLTIVEDHEEALDITRRLSRKFTKDEALIEAEVQRAGFRTMVFYMTPEHISGKRVNEK